MIFEKKEELNTSPSAYEILSEEHKQLQKDYEESLMKINQLNCLVEENSKDNTRITTLLEQKEISLIGLT
jgi:hypothetical protein